MKYKSAPAAVLTKAPTEPVSGNGEQVNAGEFEAIVSVFNVTDHDNDAVRPGAFTKSIQRWQASHDTMPVLWHHRLDDPRYNIGSVEQIAEIGPGDPRIPDWADPEVKANGGLWIKARIDSGDDASDIARHALRVLKSRRTTQFSYGYDIASGVEAKDQGPRELHEIRLYEISTTQIGANAYTELGAMKTATPEPDTGQAGAQPKCWPGAAKARAECDLLVADLQHDETDYWSL